MKDREFELIAERLITGVATPEEKQRFNDWYNSKNDELVVVPSSHDGEKEETRLRVYGHLKSHIAENSQGANGTIKGINRSIYYKIAASILLALAVSFVLYNTTWHSPDQAMEKPLAMIEKATKPGEKSKFRLPDGTTVHLNSESSLVFPEVFDANGRSVMLKGEAFFEVARDISRPFTVTSGNLLTTVLGTSFNVNAYPAGENEQVWVATGKVKVENNPNGNKDSKVNSKILTPNQGIIYDPGSQKFEKQELEISDVIAWKDGWLIFESKEFGDVIKYLERWYGVKFTIDDDSIMRRKVTLKQQNESLSAVMEVLRYLADFEYTIQGKDVTIRAID